MMNRKNTGLSGWKTIAKTILPVFLTVTVFRVVIFFIVTDPAFAAENLTVNTFFVDNSGDARDANPGDGNCATLTDVCTLRAAIEEANRRPGLDEIIIPEMTIRLSSELRTMYIYGQDTSVTIKGAGENLTIIDGNNQVRGFYFDARSGDHTISDLTIQNGRNVVYPEPNPNPFFLGSGGGIFSESGLTLTNVTVKNCKANQGGGIFSRHAFLGNIPYLTMNFVTVIGNEAATRVFGMGGGGIYSGSLMNGNNVIINENSAALQGGGLYHNSLESYNQPSELRDFEVKNNTSVDAAGIDNDLGDLNLYNGEISGNVTDGCRVDGNCTYTGGAGIYHNEGSMNIYNVSISNNLAAASGSMGGGIYNFQNMALENVSITDNRAASGAGIFNGNIVGVENQLTLINVTIGKNTGVSSYPIDAVGGGIYNLGNISIYNSTISENSAVVAGGIENQKTIQLKNSIIAQNQASVFKPDCRGILISGGYNILGNSEGCTMQPKTGDKIGIDPILGELTGKYLHYPLLEGSPAINSANNINCPDFDIRGVARPQENACDIGAYEYKMDDQGMGDYMVFLSLVIR